MDYGKVVGDSINKAVDAANAATGGAIASALGAAGFFRYITPLLIVAGVLAIAAAILAIIFILPDEKKAKMPKFIQIAADILNAKKSFLKAMLRILYIVLTLFCVIAGVLLLLIGTIMTASIGMAGQTALYGIIVLIGGPIAVRIIYEVLMLLVNISEDVKALKNGQTGTCGCKEEEHKEPQETKKPVKYVFCRQCGTKYDENSEVCPNCNR